MKKLLTIAGLVLAAVAANAGTITVTAPAAGTAANPTPVGSSTTVQFQLRDMVSQARVSATVRRVSDNTVFTNIPEVSINPDPSNRTGSGTLTVSFPQGSPEVVYRVEVRARDINNSTTYNQDQNLFLRPDLTKPKILQFNPVSGAFVKGIVPIRVQISETNLKDWRVQVDGQDIPNNTGTTVDANGRFIVNWDTSGLQTDGPRTINVRIRDEADNEESQNINVTVDRVAPIVTIQTPRSGSVIAPGTTIAVTVDVADFSATSVDFTGVDVVIRTTAGAFVTRVARQSFNQLNGTTRRWVGRIRWSNTLPSSFRITATAVDKAGNRTNTPQTVTVTIGR
ncbi:MAG TPA: hypothetical protein VEX38_02205 [Fimbriimonadaceae bacterium]|nr:hypothetical protein [Fimbriimonadaceae bacterium]